MDDNARYEIRSIKPYEYPDGVIAGGGDEWEADANSKMIAFSRAKKISKQEGIYEVIVYEYANGRESDFTGQWYFEKGKLTWDMGGNN